MKRFRVAYPTPHPVAVECAKVGWPSPDGNGDTQYENTHFDTEAECWEKLRREAEAAVTLDVGAVRTLRERLQSAEKALVESTLVLDAVKRGTP